MKSRRRFCFISELLQCNKHCSHFVVSPREYQINLLINRLLHYHYCLQFLSFILPSTLFSHSSTFNVYTCSLANSATCFRSFACSIVGHQHFNDCAVLCYTCTFLKFYSTIVSHHHQYYHRAKPLSIIKIMRKKTIIMQTATINTTTKNRNYIVVCTLGSVLCV